MGRTRVLMVPPGSASLTLCPVAPCAFAAFSTPPRSDCSRAIKLALHMESRADDTPTRRETAAIVRAQLTGA